MEDPTAKAIVVFSRPFAMPSPDDIRLGRPGGEPDLPPDPDCRAPDGRTAAGHVRMHPPGSHREALMTAVAGPPDPSGARAEDSLVGNELMDVFFEEMLAEPMVRLVMRADGVSETELRRSCSGLRFTPSLGTADVQQPEGGAVGDGAPIGATTREGAPTHAQLAQPQVGPPRSTARVPRCIRSRNHERN